MLCTLLQCKPANFWDRWAPFAICTRYKHLESKQGCGARSAATFATRAPAGHSSPYNFSQNKKGTIALRCLGNSGKFFSDQALDARLRPAR